MLKHSRRNFLKTGTVSLLYGSALLQSAEAFAKALKVPLGLQLYSVRQQLPTDYDGTLKQIGALGYREVEAAGYFNHSAAEVKQALSGAGLSLVSAHYSSDDLHKQFDQILAFNKELGVGHIVCSFPGFKDPSRVKNLSGRERLHAFTLEDWRWNAEQFNMLGEKVSAAGMKFGYHNHFLEFKQVDGVTPLDEIIRLTDPANVTFEMDCGWVIVGGGNPVDFLKKYPTRISMLHVKDFKNIEPQSNANSGAETPPTVTELGQGTIDYAPIFKAAAKAGHIRHIFVEQEAFDMPPMESLKIDADYMRKLGVV
ncbi:sugar phosphate isomerase/epimerase [Silvibacterium bohemicum]|uniref:Sugar phosphate isomerase/epimerase n=1 Tax=Silvibacterium bohemicum TaxID=1577686 RepID=A0A841JZF7_9BACT|nr:sugar phosphate isomerase/epimerase [Silvibacterium bohemicum]MBB6145089.1 sugar phosphate isomerase/epimerase [Silvibacterium bohemicum]